MSKFITFLVIVTAQYSLGASNVSCGQASVQMRGDGRRENWTVCTIEKRKIFFSETCRRKCDILEKYKTAAKRKIEIPMSGIGTPSSYLCHKIGGVPLFVEISKGNISSPDSIKICFSSQDNSFVDESIIYALIRENQ